MESEAINATRVTIADHTLKDCIAIISELINEAELKITPEGIEITAMDPSNVAMIIYRHKKEAFTEFNVEQDMTIGLNMPSFKQMLKRSKADDITTMEITESNLNLILNGKTKRKFTLPALSSEEKEQKIPELKFVAGCAMPSSILSEAIDDASLIAKSVMLIAEKDKFTAMSQGDASDVKIEIGKAEGIRINAQEKVACKYSTEYLKKMMCASKISDEVKIYFSKEYPLKLKFETDNLSMTYVLAPRVEND